MSHLLTLHNPATAMGAGMASRLLDEGYGLTVWNRSPAAAQAMASDRVTPVTDLKAAVKALGVPFDFVLPEDQKLVTAAVDQGVELSAIRRNSKLEKGIYEFAQALAVDALAPVQKRRGW